MKIVEFHEWCKKCVHYSKSESEDPCWECLDEPVNEDSRRPVNYEPKEEKSQVKQSV